MDGNVRDDPAWAGVPSATGFVQTAPDEGQPASERTEVRVVFTDDTIYFGVVCYDRDPSSIIVTDSRRDSQLSNSDSFELILDTFLDQQNGFVFGTNQSPKPKLKPSSMVTCWMVTLVLSGRLMRCADPDSS